MLKAIDLLTPQQSEVLECAAGTGSISITIAKKAKKVHCTDMSEKMLVVAKRKAQKKHLKNIVFETNDICRLPYDNDSFDIAIASQVLHLLDSPKKAADKLKRVARQSVIVPICLLDDIGFFPKIKVSIWKLLGFSPKKNFNAQSYQQFLLSIGLTPHSFQVIDGQLPMAVAVYNLKNEKIGT